jgi:hypothetical protein
MMSRSVQREAADVTTVLELPIRQRGDVDAGGRPGMVNVVQTATCRCSESEMAVIQAEFLRLFPERAECIRTKILELIACGLDAKGVEAAMREEVERMEPEVLRERQARVARIWDGGACGDTPLTTEFEERLRAELDKADDVARTKGELEACAQQAKAEADDAQKMATEAKARRDRARATGVGHRPPLAEDGEKKKQGLFGCMKFFS